MARELSFRTLGQSVSIECEDAEAGQLLAFNFAAMQINGRDVPVAPAGDLSYRVRKECLGQFSLVCPGDRVVDCEGLGGLLYALEHDLTVALQRQRPELFFVHAAALEYSGRAFVLAGASGHGKSTTTWGLLHRGLKFLSDELSPIDLATLCVHAYPRALNLKSEPPPLQPLPARGVYRLPDSIHVGLGGIPVMSEASILPIDSIVFVHYASSRTTPTLRKLSAAEAGARLYATTLNALAHADQGIDAALRIASLTRCFALESADLKRSCDLFCEQLLGGGAEEATDVAS